MAEIRTREMNILWNVYSCAYTLFFEHTNITHAVTIDDNVNRSGTVDRYIETMLLDPQRHL